MRQVGPALVCVGLLATACDRAPVQPTLPPTPLPSVSVPAPGPFADQYSDIKIGETISRRVTADTPNCLHYPQWSCLYFRFTPETDGNVEVALSSPAPVPPVDMSVNDASGREWWSDLMTHRLVVNIVVRAGTTYQIAIWYVSPGVEFELGCTLR